MPINQDTMSGPSFSLSNRLGRVAWGLVYWLAFWPSPRPFHGWRAILLRLFGAHIGKGCHIYPGVRIWAPWNLTCGEGSGVAGGAILYSQGRITLGERVVVSQGAHLCAGTHDFEAPGFPLVTAPITIGNDAWVAAEAFVHPGVHIGEGCVVGARAVVTKDLPPWMVCVGHPARPLRERKRFGPLERGDGASGAEQGNEPL